jgi:hypothetical protein
VVKERLVMVQGEDRHRLDISKCESQNKTKLS